MIIDRRVVLKSGAAVYSAALLPGLAAGESTQAGPSIERFVFDSRFPDAVEAAQSAAALGVALSEVGGDLTDLWYNDLNLRWKKRPMTLAGVTAEDALFVLGTLAPEFRMRVVRNEEIGDAVMRNSERFGSLPLYAWVIAPAG